MKTMKIWLAGLGLAALLASCASPTSDSSSPTATPTPTGTPTATPTPTPTPTPGVTKYLFSTAGTTDVTCSVDNWSSGTTIDSAFTSDATYTPVIKLTSGTGWGPVSAIGFNSISPAGTLNQYTGFTFKIKATGYTTIQVKFPASSLAGQVKSYTISAGTTLAGGWKQITVPFSDFTSMGTLENQVGIFEFGAGSILLTDIGFTGSATVSTAALTASISAAQTLLAAHTVGSADGNVPQAAHDDYAAAIATAQAATTTTWAQIDSALSALEAAAPAFNAAIIHLAPTTLPAAPSLSAASVISLYTSSATYTDISGITWNPGWGQTGSITDKTVATKTVKLLSLKAPGNYQGVDFAATVQDITGKTTLHISYFTANGTAFKVYAVNAAGAGGAYAADTNPGVASGSVTQGTWNDLEIDLTGQHTNIQQLKFDTGIGDYYLDNIYFH